MTVKVLTSWTLLTAVLVARGAETAAVGSVQSVRDISDNCDSQIYCTGELLHTIQMAELFNDSKTFVDMYQLNDPNVTYANFQKLMNATNGKPSKDQLMQYVNENFDQRDELINVTLSDWQENPPILKVIEDPSYRKWAKDLNDIWKTLARKINPDVKNNPQRHSIIYVDNPFVIPGGRFKEFYYWDSYWVIEGLLYCGMNVTARNMIDNFLQMVEQFGFIPNGGRVYYLMRSQPPLLIPMIEQLVKATGDFEYLAKVMPVLEKEFNFWQNNKTVVVRKNGKSYIAARYVVNSASPRPESYSEDYNLSLKLPEGQARLEFFDDIKAGAESGWDFSYRWCIHEGPGNISLADISTKNYIPVDLNSILERNARLLAEFSLKLGNEEKARQYIKIAKEYQAVMDDLLWDEEEGTWLDYDLKHNKPRKGFYVSNLTPLYTGSYSKTNVRYYALRTIEYLKRNSIVTFIGGTPASLNETGEQWDYPNAWPPLQSFIVMGLHKTGVKEAKLLANDLASRWLRSNYLGYEQNGKMYEKYSALEPGQAGGGGEYVNQEGFGWTNGVVLGFLNTFPDLSPYEDYSAESWDITSNEIDR